MSQLAHPYENQEPQSEAVFTAGYVRLLVLQVAFGVSYSAFLLLPKFLRTELSASAAEIGALAGLSVVAAAVLSPMVGALSSRFDRRWLLTFAILLEGGSAFGFTTVTEVGPFAYVLRVFQGLGFVLMFTTTSTLVAEHVHKSKLGQAIGWMGLAMLLTNALAPLVTEPLAATMGWSFAFRTSGFLALGALLFIPGVKVPAPTRSTKVRMFRVHAGQASLYYASLLVGAGIGCLFTFVQPYALELGAKDVGKFFLGYVLTAAIVRGAFGAVPDKYGAVRVAAWSMALYAMVTFAAAWVTPSTLFALGMGLGVCHGMIYPALSARGLSLTPVSERSMFMGWFFGAFNVGFAIAVIALGPLADKYGFAPIFIGAGVWIATGVFPLVAEKCHS